MNIKDALRKKIDTRQIKICIIGLGYVGLPLGLEFADAGFEVYGLDINQKRISSLKKGKSYVDDISDRDLKEAVCKKLFKPVNSYAIIKNCDCIIICVPTPLSKTKEPDISFIVDCFNNLRSFIG